MTVAVEPEVQAERREVLVSRKKFERARESQAELIPIERQAFHLLEHLSEVHG